MIVFCDEIYYTHRQLDTQLRAVGSGLRTGYDTRVFVDARSRPLVLEVWYRQQGRD
jgi:hypothetical protein